MAMRNERGKRSQMFILLLHMHTHREIKLTIRKSNLTNQTQPGRMPFGT